MLRPFFELFRIITIQYSFVYTVQMQKQNKTKNPPKEQTNKQKKQEKHKHCATKEQIPSFRIAFQKLDEC